MHMPVAALAAFVALASPSAILSRPVLDFESDFDAASRLYDAGNAKGALAKMQQLAKSYPNEYKGARLYHLEVALAANEQQGRVFAKSLITGPFASDWASLAGIAPAVEHLKAPQPATWNLALFAAKRASQINPKSAEAQEAIGISNLGLNQKPIAKAAFDKAVALAKKDPAPDSAYIAWLVDRRTKLTLRKL